MNLFDEDEHPTDRELRAMVIACLLIAPFALLGFILEQAWHLLTWPVRAWRAR